MDRKDLGVCLIGCGRAGMIHAHNFCKIVPGTRIAAVVDVVEDAAKVAAADCRAEAWYTDYKKMLSNPAVDAVVVVSPTDLHRQIVIDCANAKKHVFCEKPMAMNSIECQDMIDACEANHVKLQIGFMRRYDRSFRHAKQLLEEGVIGDLVQIHSHTRGPSKPRPWMYDLKKSNGILAEVNSHDIDSIRWFSGSEVDMLYAIGGNYRNPEIRSNYPDYYDSCMVSGALISGVQFSLNGAAYVQYGYDSHVELVGTKGVIHVGRSEADFVKCTTVENGTSNTFVNSWRVLFEDAYLAEDTAFAEAIRNDSETFVTGLDGMMAVRIVEAGNRSIRTGEIVRL